MALGTCLGASSASADQIKASVGAAAGRKVSLWQTRVNSSFLPPSRLRSRWSRTCGDAGAVDAPCTAAGQSHPARWRILPLFYPCIAATQ